MNFNCKICNFSTNLKSNYNRHLNTIKHKKNTKTIGKINPQNEEYSSNIPPPPSNIPPYSSKILQNEEYSSKILQDLSYKNSDSFVCEYCKKTFTRKDNLNKHQKSRCHKMNNLEKKIEELKIQYEEKISKYEEENSALYKHIDKLLEKVGDTNITQNVVINCYGKEDLSHIDNNFKLELLKIPYGMIPKMIEEVHFKCPQNNNIYVPNKKEPYVKIFSDDKWIYKDRKSTIKELIDINYNRIDDYYSADGNNKLDDSQQKRYLEFNLFNEKIKDGVEKKVDLLLLNKLNN